MYRLFVCPSSVKYIHLSYLVGVDSEGGELVLDMNVTVDVRDILNEPKNTSPPFGSSGINYPMANSKNISSTRTIMHKPLHVEDLGENMPTM